MAHPLPGRLWRALYFQYGIKLNNVFDTQIAYTLLKEQHGKKWVPDDYISFVDLLADERYCGVVYDEKEEVRVLLRKDPQFWAHRPWTVMMKRVAADDVRFLLRIYERMVKSLTELSKWRLSVRSSLYCQCFCAGDDCFLGCPLPPPPEQLINGELLQEEVLAVVDVPSGKMGLVIGRKGSSILSIKQCCRADIFIGGQKGPPDKIFVIGAVKEVRKAEAILRGKFLPN
uniref:K Homology domain-containing protein n=1 Tax=Physcomitrium patens TaxID=3218 RepID=A0A7I4EGU3_PHYPA